MTEGGTAGFKRLNPRVHLKSNMSGSFDLESPGRRRDRSNHSLRIIWLANDLKHYRDLNKVFLFWAQRPAEDTSVDDQSRTNVKNHFTAVTKRRNSVVL